LAVILSPGKPLHEGVSSTNSSNLSGTEDMGEGRQEGEKSTTHRLHIRLTGPDEKACRNWYRTGDAVASRLGLQRAQRLTGDRGLHRIRPHESGVHFYR
jgi:hypothetical protein